MKVMTEATDADALALLSQRSQRGLEIAYARYATAVRSFLFRMARTRELADDLLQQTFLRLAEKGPSLRPDSDLRAWLFAVARNAYRDTLRRNLEYYPEEGVLTALPSHSPEAEAQLVVRDLELALGSLRPDDREILLLIAVEGLDHDTVARILGLEPATMRQRLSRARARLLLTLDRQAPAQQTEEKKPA